MGMMGAEPTIGYRNPEAIRHMRASGRLAMPIRNVKDMNDFVEKKMNGTHDAIVEHSVSKKVRRQMLEIAKKHNVRIANVSAKSVERVKKPEKAKAVVKGRGREGEAGGGEGHQPGEAGRGRKGGRAAEGRQTGEGRGAEAGGGGQGETR